MNMKILNINIKLILALLALGPLPTHGQEPGPLLDTDWFYLVKTVSIDPVRDDEFNAWYDDIDIPDVLAVPDFRRARRAEGQDISRQYQSEHHEGRGKYVALYDIESDDIDKSIIDLYVAARKMTALGRITDLLRVTEANYYSRELVYDGSTEMSGEVGNLIYIQKILCCKDESQQQQLKGWISTVLLPGIDQATQLSRASLYDLYRIMEEVALEPEEIPHMLLVYELEAGSADKTVNAIRITINGLSKSGNWITSFIEGDDSSVYLQRSSVLSK